MAPRPPGWAHPQLLPLGERLSPSVRLPQLLPAWQCGEPPGRRGPMRFDQADEGRPLKPRWLVLPRLWEKVPGTHSGVCPDPGRSRSPTGLSAPALTHRTLVPRKGSPTPRWGASAPIRLDVEPQPPAADLWVPGAEDAGYRGRSLRPGPHLQPLSSHKDTNKPRLVPQSRKGRLEVSAGGGE